MGFSRINSAVVCRGNWFDCPAETQTASEGGEVSTFTEMQTVSYFTDECFKCGVRFAMEANFNHERMDKGLPFYCPNGHEQIYGKSNAMRLEEANRALAQSQAETRAAKERLAVKLRRVDKGICPCCKRHFENLKRFRRKATKKGKK